MGATWLLANYEKHDYKSSAHIQQAFRSYNITILLPRTPYSDGQIESLHSVGIILELAVILCSKFIAYHKSIQRYHRVGRLYMVVVCVNQEWHRGPKHPVYYRVNHWPSYAITGSDIKADRVGVAWAELVTTSIDSLPTSKLNYITWRQSAKGAWGEHWRTHNSCTASDISSLHRQGSPQPGIKAERLGVVWAEFVTTSIDSFPTSKLN